MRSYIILFLSIVLLLFLLFVSGCSKVCKCECGNCGDSCRLQCTEVNCTPGTPCCSKCICDPTSK